MSCLPSPRPLAGALALAAAGVLVPAGLASAGARVAAAATASTQPANVAPAGDPVPAVAIDGDFDDWSEADPLLVDPLDAPGNELDLRAVRAVADGRFLHLHVETTRPVCLQGLDRPLELLLDADGNPGSGASIELLSGLDVVVAFSPVDPRRPDRPGSGVGVEVFGVDRADAPNAYALDLHFAPSHASDRFEIRLRRGSDLPNVGRVLAGRRVTGRLVQRAADGAIIDETEPFTVELPAFDPAPATGRGGGPNGAPGGGLGAADPLARTPDALRVMVWNAERGVMVRRAGATGRLVRATSPDVILLQELTEEIPASRVERLLESALPGEDWTVHVGRGGGPLRCVVATRLPSAVVTELDPLPQPDRPDREIRTAARLIESPEGRVLAVSVHLKCCGRPGDESDRRRITEARTIRAAMARVIAEEEPDAVVIGGDLNLVGTRTPLEILLGGLDVDGSELTVVDAMQPAPGASNATWYQPDSRFTPGRLDFVLVSDASLQPVRSLVLNGLHMTGPRWTRGGLRPDDTLISDHFPILVDLEWGAR